MFGAKTVWVTNKKKVINNFFMENFHSLFPATEIAGYVTLRCHI